MKKVSPRMETLSEHNKRVGSAGVACDNCGTGMDIDRSRQQMERQSAGWPTAREGTPVVCPKCGLLGRMLNCWA